MDDKAPAHNMKAVIKETGLTPATLRAWERRYGLIRPHRTAKGHRLYTQGDIDMIQEVVELLGTGEGWLRVGGRVAGRRRCSRDHQPGRAGDVAGVAQARTARSAEGRAREP